MEQTSGIIHDIDSQCPVFLVNSWSQKLKHPTEVAYLESFRYIAEFIDTY